MHSKCILIEKSGIHTKINKTMQSKRIKTPEIKPHVPGQLISDKSVKAIYGEKTISYTKSTGTYEKKILIHIIYYIQRICQHR